MRSPGIPIPGREISNDPIFLVYCVTNTKNGKRYVGVTTMTPKLRWNAHLSEARQGSTKPLHKAIRKFGTSAFKLSLLHACRSESRGYSMERRWIAKLGSVHPLGYNLSTGGKGARGVKVSKSTRAKMAESSRGRSHSDETKLRLSKIKTGKSWGTHTPDSRRRISASNSGLKRSDDTCKRISESHIGYVPSKEARKNMSIAAIKAWIKRRKRKL